MACLELRPKTRIASKEITEDLLIPLALEAKARLSPLYKLNSGISEYIKFDVPIICISDNQQGKLKGGIARPSRIPASNDLHYLHSWIDIYWELLSHNIQYYQSTALSHPFACQCGNHTWHYSHFAPITEEEYTMLILANPRNA